MHGGLRPESLRPVGGGDGASWGGRVWWWCCARWGGEATILTAGTRTSRRQQRKLPTPYRRTGAQGAPLRCKLHACVCARVRVRVLVRPCVCASLRARGSHGSLSSSSDLRNALRACVRARPRRTHTVSLAPNWFIVRRLLQVAAVRKVAKTSQNRIGIRIPRSFPRLNLTLLARSPTSPKFRGKSGSDSPIHRFTTSPARPPVGRPPDMY